MADINLNPQILPSRKVGGSKEHHKFVTVAVWAAVGAVLIGGVYWWGNREAIAPPSDLADQLSARQEVAASLNKVIIHTSPAEAQKIANELSQQKTSTSQDLPHK